MRVRRWGFILFLAVPGRFFGLGFTSFFFIFCFAVLVLTLCALAMRVLGGWVALFLRLGFGLVVLDDDRNAPVVGGTRVVFFHQRLVGKTTHLFHLIGA